MGEEIDLGSDHWLRWIEWEPDPELNPQYADLPERGPGEHHGCIVRHRPGPVTPNQGREWCEGGITFDTPRAHRGGFDPLWQVHSWDPLTVSPSLLCECGDHGYIRDGLWFIA
jgi:hypothetical protein